MVAVVNITKANSTSPTIPSTTAGNCLLVLVGSKNTSGAASVSSVKLGGAAGNFASLAAAHGTDSFTAWCDAFAWADPNCAGGQTAVAISGTDLNLASGDGGVTILEISGIAASSPLDASSTGDAISSNFSSGGAATAVANELWAAVAATTGSAAGPGSPWTDESPAGGAVAAGYQIVSSTGTATYAGTCTNEAWAALVVTLKQGSVLVSSSDSGSGADSSAIAATASGTETGSGADVGVIDQRGTETGSGADTASLAASVPGADTGSGADVATVGVAGSDSGSGADSATAVLGATGAETGTGTDTAAITGAGIPAGDTGTGADTTSIAAALPAAADTGSGAEAAEVVITSSDTGTGTELASQARYIPPPAVLWKAPDKLSKTGGVMA